MTNEEKIAELIKVSKMPMEEAIAYMKKSIAKSKMENTINGDNENNEVPTQIGDDPDEFYRKLGAIPFKEFAENIYNLKPNEKQKVIPANCIRMGLSPNKPSYRNDSAKIQTNRETALAKLN